MCILTEQSTASFHRTPTGRKQTNGDVVETVKSKRPSAGSCSYTVTLVSESQYSNGDCMSVGDILGLPCDLRSS